MSQVEIGHVDGAMPFCTVRKLDTWPMSILPSSPVGVTIRFWK